MFVPGNFPRPGASRLQPSRLSGLTEQTRLPRCTQTTLTVAGLKPILIGVLFTAAGFKAMLLLFFLSKHHMI